MLETMNSMMESSIHRECFLSGTRGQKQGRYFLLVMPCHS
jgi:hypothetical protein